MHIRVWQRFRQVKSLQTWKCRDTSKSLARPEVHGVKVEARIEVHGVEVEARKRASDRETLRGLGT